MKLSDNPEQLITEFFSEQLFAILSTQNIKGPHMVIVSFIVTKNLKEIAFVTPRQTRKYKNIMESSLVSLYVDNRSNDIRDLQRLTGIEVIGNAYEINENEKDQYREFYLAKYPDLKDFINSPTSSILKIDVSKYEIINHFQNVTTLEIK